MQRQPFGGWKQSAVGPGTKAGGPNYLVGLGSWECARSTAETTELSPAADRLLRAAEQLDLAPWQLDFLTRSFASDATA